LTPQFATILLSATEIQTQVNAINPFKTVSKELKDKPWHVEGSDNAGFLWIM
jgi:hypothetical protein